ncbi:ABC transporter permease [Xanthocytophaga agilis]|uniref:ABC transporter permease n=1 Tax=Xanthocytophaga agilis TaxID=3048010 RepID=A0AAE3RCJ6_9BACT|nr:FtsX-like permease family protein [Xanthocytophaga agilis]MDJ1505759.1 ABC transporter permease [Xanthocytophaga agilis]
MLKTYLKFSIILLKRNLFFTAISLIGTVITLTFLVFFTSLIENFINPSYPDTNRGACLYITKIKVMNTQKGYYSAGGLSLTLIDNFISKLKQPQQIAIISSPKSLPVFTNNQESTFAVRFVNEQFWDVYHFNFLWGSQFNRQQCLAKEPVIVLASAMAQKIFGKTDVRGQTLNLNGKLFRIIGLVKDASIFQRYVMADAYIPYSSLANPSDEIYMRDAKDRTFIGDYNVVLYSQKANGLTAMEEEFNKLKGLIESDLPAYHQGFNKVFIYADDFLSSFTRISIGPNREDELNTFLLCYVLFSVFCMLLPALNLININTSRIMERWSEIGIRRSFGATRQQLFFQFLIENMVLNFIGFGLSICLVLALIGIFNYSQIIDNLLLKLDCIALVMGMLFTLLFSFLSGVIPAWRMSKINPVDAINNYK